MPTREFYVLYLLNRNFFKKEDISWIPHTLKFAFSTDIEINPPLTIFAK